MMQLHVALLPEQLPNQWQHPAQTLAIVIDTLRFTTTACQALSAGARCVQIAAQVQAARELAESTPLPASGKQRPLLCGERLCQPIPGFDLGNSPAEYTPSRVSARHLIFTTTNGTRAVAAARGVSQIWLAAMVNRRAVVQRLAETSADQVWLICAGTDGQVACEDVLVAGAIIDELGIEPMGDAAQLASYAWQAVTSQIKGPRRNGEQSNGAQMLPEILERDFQRAAGGHNLLEAGFADDVRFATRLDSLDEVPRSKQPWDIFVRW